MKPTSTRAKDWVLAGLGVLAILAGLAVGWKRAHTAQQGEGVDFAVLHVMAVGIARGVNVYALNEHSEGRANVAGVSYPPGAMGLVVYPPVTGVPLLPFGLLPYETAKLLFFVLLNAAMLMGIRSLVRLVAPERPAYAWLIAAGVVMMSAAIRWGMMLLQGAPLMLGLLCFLVVALHRGRPRLALAIGVVATAFKMTLALPFLGLLLLHRRFGAVAAAGLAWIGCNVLGFLRMGPAAFATYQTSVAKFEDVNDVTNINSPDPWTLVSLPRLDWVYLFYGVTGHVTLSRLLSLACSGLVALGLLYLGWRAPRPSSTPDAASVSTSTTFLAALVCLGSLCVYHHQYDLCLLFAPLIMAWFAGPAVRTPAWAPWLVAPVALVMLLLPIGTAGNMLYDAFGSRGVGLMKLSFPLVLTAALIGSLAVINRAVSRPGYRLPPPARSPTTTAAGPR